MRGLNSQEIKSATLKYSEGSDRNSRGYYVHIKFNNPVVLDEGDKPLKDIYTLMHLTPESAIQNFKNIFDDLSEFEKTTKRTLIDSVGFIF